MRAVLLISVFWQFLEYVVSQTLAGNADRNKCYTVATEVFERGTDFDQSIGKVTASSKESFYSGPVFSIWNEQ